MEMEPFTGIKRSRSTIRQLEALVDQMLKNKNLALGRYTGGPTGYIKNQKLWRKVAFRISAFGPRKTYIQTKTTWRDLKKKVRKKKALVNKLSQSAEHKGPIPAYTDLDLKVLSIIDTDKSESITDPEEDDDEEEEEQQQELDLFSIQSETIPEVNMYVEHKPINMARINMGTFKEYKAEVTDNDTKRPLFVDVLQGMPPIAAEFSVSPSHIPSNTKTNNFEATDDGAKHYAALHTETNKTLKEIVSIFKKYSEDNLQLLKERNEIERERNRLKLLQINMQMKNGSQIHNKDDDGYII